MTDDTDRELRERFHTLRGDVGRGAPAFSATLSSLARLRRSRSGLRHSMAAIAAAASVGLVVFAVAHSGARRAPLVGLAVVRWEGPTDFLLETPGAELLRTVPEFTMEGRLLP